MSAVKDKEVVGVIEKSTENIILVTVQPLKKIEKRKSKNDFYNFELDSPRNPKKKKNYT